MVRDGLSALNLYAAIVAGRSDGSWTGSHGIRSASAALSPEDRTIGWLDNGDGSVTFGYAAPGDSNLDWQIDVLDVANLVGSSTFNNGISATWATGDFNYDGYADILDMADLMSSGLFNAGNYNTPAAGIAAVPEPSTLAAGLIGTALGTLCLVRRQRT